MAEAQSSRSSISGEPAAADRVPSSDPFAIGRLRLENEQLRIELRQTLAAMASREVIEQAKGLLMGRFRCGEQRAFALLSTLSQRSNQKLRAVAVAIVDEASRAGEVRYPGLDEAAEVVLRAEDPVPNGESRGARPAGWR
jgi:hypothetical protein